MGRGQARDRLPDYVAAAARSVARTARDRKGLTNPDIALILRWDANRVRDALARKRPLRAATAAPLLCAVRSARPRPNSIDAKSERSAALTNSHIDTVLAGIDKSRRVPAALIPRWEIHGIACYVVHVMSQLRPDIGPKRVKFYTELIQRALKRAAMPMARQFYQYHRERWVKGCPADLLLQQYGLPSDDEFLVYDEEN